MQLSIVANSLPPERKIGIITADGSKLRASPALALCGLADADRAVIYGIEHSDPMQNVLNLKGQYCQRASPYPTGVMYLSNRSLCKLILCWYAS